MSLKSTLISKASRLQLHVSKYAPPTLLAVGLVGIVASSALTVKATYKSAPNIKKFKKEVNKLKANKEKFSNKEYKKELSVLVDSNLKPVVKEYISPVVVGVASIGCILGSYKILNTRNISLAGAYVALDKAYKNYRENVKLEYGEEVDLKMITTPTAIGQPTDQLASRVVPGHLVGPYSVWFDESNINYENDSSINRNFLHTQQNYWNDRLRARGHVFLNEVYEALGFNHTSAGAVTGWVYNTKTGDGFIDFGIYDSDLEVNKSFLTGHEKQVLLNFNVDGLIWDLI